MISMRVPLILTLLTTIGQHAVQSLQLLQTRVLLVDYYEPYDRQAALEKLIKLAGDSDITLLMWSDKRNREDINQLLEHLKVYRGAGYYVASSPDLVYSFYYKTNIFGRVDTEYFKHPQNPTVHPFIAKFYWAALDGEPLSFAALLLTGKLYDVQAQHLSQVVKMISGDKPFALLGSFHDGFLNSELYQWISEDTPVKRYLKQSKKRVTTPALLLNAMEKAFVRIGNPSEKNNDMKLLATRPLFLDLDLDKLVERTATEGEVVIPAYHAHQQYTAPARTSHQTPKQLSAQHRKIQHGAATNTNTDGEITDLRAADVLGGAKAVMNRKQPLQLDYANQMMRRTYHWMSTTTPHQISVDAATLPRSAESFPSETDSSKPTNLNHHNSNMGTILPQSEMLSPGRHFQSPGKTSSVPAIDSNTSRQTRVIPRLQRPPHPSTMNKRLPLPSIPGTPNHRGGKIPGQELATLPALTPWTWPLRASEQRYPDVQAHQPVATPSFGVAPTKQLLSVQSSPPAPKLPDVLHDTLLYTPGPRDHQLQQHRPLKQNPRQERHRLHKPARSSYRTHEDPYQ